MSINQIVTPLDSAVLETKEQYQVYFKIVTHAFNELVEKIANEKICTPVEASFVMQYGGLLTYSLEAFRVKYLFDADEKMRIDLTESGFPNYLEFRYLFNDLELKQEHISKLPKLETVKEEFLETLLKDKQPISDHKLHQAASLVYYTSVDQQYIFRRFVQGKILEAKDNEFEAQYMVSWSFYDVTTNRPFICFMYFDLHKEKLEEYKSEIYNVLETTADRDMSIDMMAYAIDKKLENLQPKKIRKFDLGPLHSVFAKDEIAITHVILKAIVAKTFDLSAYAISVHVDEAISTGSFTEGSFFNKQQLQVWEAKPQKHYLFCSHRVMQSLYDNIPETINSLTQDPIEIRGLKLN
tara:strand:+ start:287 stop:1345 length:1059 start_codon:yes stop_codon:yes gene_type:complete